MPAKFPDVAYSVRVRALYPNRVGILGSITSAIGAVGGDITAVDIADSRGGVMVRDFTVSARDLEHGQEVVAAIERVASVRVLDVSDPTFQLHLGGKIEMQGKRSIRTQSDLAMLYEPGGARVSVAIRDDPASVWTLTSKANTVAIVTDGSRVLGLGNIGPLAAMPVMEGKALLFKELGGVDAWPICLATQDPDEIVATVRRIGTGFGGINLEDIATPRCFYVEQRLQEVMDIPVFHDDQHGTAVVILAALINAAQVVNKSLEELRVVICGVGAAGTACGKMLVEAGIKEVIGCDKEGVLYRGADYKDHPVHAAFAQMTNPRNIRGGLEDALEGADAVICVSAPGAITARQIARMNVDPIVFALANPEPEIRPEELDGLARVVATGRSDYPNQVNNVLCFPGMFRGALDVRARVINQEMKLAAAQAIAASVPRSDMNEDHIIPSVFDVHVVRNVAQAVARAAHKTGVARRIRHKAGGFSPVGAY